MDNVVFKQSVMGFNRIQVLEYIDTLVKELKDCEDRYADKQQQLQQEIDTLASKCEESKKDLNLTAERIKELSDELEYFKSNNAELKNQIDYYKNLILNKDGELVNIKRENINLRSKCDLLSAENDSWKKRQDKIGACLIEAEMRAEEIVKQAEQDALETKKSIEEQAARLSVNVVDLKSEISRVEAQLEQSFAKLQKAMETMDCSAKTIEQQVDSYKSKVQSMDTSAKRAEQKNERFTLGGEEKACIKAKPQKKSLTDNVLDTISKILGQ